MSSITIPTEIKSTVHDYIEKLIDIIHDRIIELDIQEKTKCRIIIKNPISEIPMEYINGYINVINYILREIIIGFRAFGYLVMGQISYTTTQEPFDLLEIIYLKFKWRPTLIENGQAIIRNGRCRICGVDDAHPLYCGHVYCMRCLENQETINCFCFGERNKINVNLSTLVQLP